MVVGNSCDNKSLMSGTHLLKRDAYQKSRCDPRMRDALLMASDTNGSRDTHCHCTLQRNLLFRPDR